MKQQHHPHDIKLYATGANRDTDDELIGLQDGQYIDACNMRTMPMDGDNSSIKKINGEVVLYPNIDNRCNGGTNQPLSSTYECIGVAEIQDNIVEFWADAAEIEPSLIRVNGKIVLMSEDFPIQAKYPLQIARNEACIGGEVYITDYNVIPMLYNIKDLLLNSGVDVGNEEGECTEKYFGDYNHQEHVLVLTRALNHPVFIKLDASASGYDYVFGASGLNVGYHSYSFRYVSQDGDRTAWSAPTPQIPVVKRLSIQCDIHPWVKTISKDPDVSSPSVYGIHVKFRIDNRSAYDFIEVRRDSWEAGDPLGTAAVSSLIGFIDIVDGQFGVVNVLDRGGFEETLTVDDTTTVMAALDRAKAIRYFNQRLYLMNVEYASRDITDAVEFIDEDTPDVAFPTIQKMGKSGHNDPYNAAYHKSIMRGEKHGWGVVLWDEQGQNSFATEILGAGNYEMPNRRIPTSSLTEGTSYYGTVKAANVNGSVSQTHEVFDLEDAVSKDDKCSWANILDANNGRLFPFTNIDGCPSAEDEGYVNSITGIVEADRIGYKPFTPVSQDSLDCRYHNYIVNLQVRNNNGSDDWEEYRPEGFEPNYYSMGLAFKGLSSQPSWAKSFSIVRTAPANRVVAQGLGYYSMKSGESGFGANVSKDIQEFAIYFPDLDSDTGIDPAVVEAIKASPSSFKIQLVSPMGFFSEIFHYDVSGSEGDKAVDFITYCRILKDNGEINPNENPNMGIDDGSGNRYVAYGKWRANTDFTPSFENGTWDTPTSGVFEGLFDIEDFLDYTSSSSRMKYFRVRTNQSVYGEIYTGGDHRGDESGVQNWHEPVYAVNIVRVVADIADTNIQQYEYTGHYQKFESVVGISDGTDGQIYELTDERWEDCIQTTNNEVQNDYASLERFVFVRDANGNEKRWLNVTDKSPATILSILNDLQSFGVHTATDSSGNYDIYGVYTSQEGIDFTAPTFQLTFEWFDTSYSQEFFLPVAEEQIIVKYDNRIPIRVFGGDTWINESVWAVKDKVYNKDGDPVVESEDDGSGSGDIFRLNVAFPYREYDFNPRIYIINDTQSIVDKVQNAGSFDFSKVNGSDAALIRQLIAMWTAETRVNLSFAFNDESIKHSSDQYFALKNYVMRPQQWDDNEFGNGASAVYSANNIFSDYADDYGDEFLLWGYGGFRFTPQTNIDYSKKDNTRGFTSTPKVGYEEQNFYCTRIIWSEQRPINIQDSPTVRTFPEGNTYDLDDGTGEIKFGWSADSGKGNNLYAVTENGVALLLVDKRIVHEINANELATVGSDIGGILNELWLEREIGMNDEFWRSAAEYSNKLYWCNQNSSYVLTENQVGDIGRAGYHSKIYPEYLEIMEDGYTDKITGVYDVLHDEYWVGFRKQEFIPEEFSFISRLYLVNDTYGDGNYTGSYYGLGENETLIASIQRPLEEQTGIVLGGYPDNNMLTWRTCIQVSDDSPYPIRVTDSTFNELIIIQQGECYCFTPVFSVENPKDVVGFTYEVCEPITFGDCPTLVWGDRQKMWQGAFSYDFDRYLSWNNKTYGMRDLETYLLDEGRIINGELIEAHVVHASVAMQYKDKEFIRIRINSDNKPTKVEFFNELSEYLNDDPQALLDTVLNPLHLKDYYGFEQYIPRKTDAPHNRMQGRLLIFKIIHNLDEDFRLTSSDVQYKPLK